MKGNKSMPNLSIYNLRSGCAVLALCVLAAVVVPIAASTPASAQDWIVDDNPEFYDEKGDYSWFTPPSNVNSTGYGTNGFRFTIAIGNDPRELTDSWAQWDIGHVNGIYEIEVWIPSAWATANAGYEVWEDSSRIDTAWINQQNVSGWQPLGTYDLDGYLRISVYDAVTQDDYRTVGIANARLAVDALRMRRVDANPQPTPPPPPLSTAPGPPRNLSLTLTDADSFHIDWDPPSDDGGSPITEYGVAVQHAGSGDISGWSTVGTSTSFDGVVGATYTVEVWAKNSQGSGPAQRAQITIPSAGERKVTISLGPNNSGSQYCTYSQLPCRWINIKLEDFSRGSYFTRCVWLHNESGSERVPISGDINHGGTNSAYLNNYCSFNVREGRSVWVTVDGIQSNILNFTGDGQSPPAPDDPTDASETPGRPQSVRVAFEGSSDNRRIVLRWSPPSNDGGSAITGYTVTVTSARERFGPYNRSATYRTASIRLTPGRSNTEFTARVVARNRHGSGAEARLQFRTPRDEESCRPPDPVFDLRLNLEESSTPRRLWASWSAPDDGGCPITGYELVALRDGRKNRQEPNTVRFGPYEAEASSRRMGVVRNYLRDTEYRVQIVAINSAGESYQNTERITIPCRPAGKKFRIDDGFGTDPIFSEQSFRAGNGAWIDEDTQGGELNKESNLSQEGCSWIFKGADVLNSAVVSGNAVVLDCAKVTENAKVYGNAVVKDCGTRVEGDAHVYGNAEISGGSKIKGDARIGGDVKIDDVTIESGLFNGRAEYLRSFAELYGIIYEETFSILRNCFFTKYRSARLTDGEIHKLVENVIWQTMLDGQLAVEAGYYIRCSNWRAIGKALGAVLPSWLDLIRLLGDVSTLLNLFDAAADVDKWTDAERLFGRIRGAYSELESKFESNSECLTALHSIRESRDRRDVDC